MKLFQKHPFFGLLLGFFFFPMMCIVAPHDANGSPVMEDGGTLPPDTLNDSDRVEENVKADGVRPIACGAGEPVQETEKTVITEKDEEFLSDGVNKSGDQ